MKSTRLTQETSKIQSFLARVTHKIRAQDGGSIAEALSYNSRSAYELFIAAKTLYDAEGVMIPNMIRSGSPYGIRIPEGWVEVFATYFQVLWHLHHNNWEETASAQNNLASAFFQVLMKLDRWALPILYTICSQLRDASVRADDSLQMRGEKATRLEEAARTLNRAYSLCAADRLNDLPSSRKWGTYFIVNLLFRIYFKLNSTNLCATVVRSLGSAQLPALSEYPIGQQVTHRFYLGVLNFQNEKYKQAIDDLMFALEHCPTTKEACTRSDINKLLILNYIIPAQLSQGILPFPKLLHKYPFMGFVYGEFCWAIQTGNLALFDEALVRNEVLLIRLGTWLNVERARAFVIRSLFKKVWIIHDRSARIPMSSFQHALQFASSLVSSTQDTSQTSPSAISMDQVECFLAIMIDRGYMKGYLSQEKQMVVLSKQDPFPRISSVQQV